MKDFIREFGGAVIYNLVIPFYYIGKFFESLIPFKKSEPYLPHESYNYNTYFYMGLYEDELEREKQAKIESDRKFKEKIKREKARIEAKSEEENWFKKYSSFDKIDWSEVYDKYPNWNKDRVMHEKSKAYWYFHERKSLKTADTLKTLRGENARILEKHYRRRGTNPLYPTYIKALERELESLHGKLKDAKTCYDTAEILEQMSEVRRKMRR